MKKLIMLVVGGILSAAMAFVLRFETVGGYTWPYLNSGVGDTVEIFNNRSFAISPEPAGSVTIPSMLGGKSVTSLGEGAFRNCRRLTSVTIPSGVVSIGLRAFEGCSGLKSVRIPDSVTRIYDKAFWNCSGLTSVTIGNRVTSIGGWAFYGCTNLTDVTIPSSIKGIGTGAFFSHCHVNGSHYSNCKTALKTVHVEAGDTDRVKSMLSVSHDVSGITFVEDVGGGSGGDVAEIWKKAQTVNGAVFRDGRAVGVVQVKVGKASKNGEVPVSGTITGLDGKKLAAKGGKVGVSGRTATATLAVKDGTTATVTVGKDGVSGSWNGAEIKAAEVGGKWTRTDAKVQVAATSATLPAGTLEALLPDGETVLAKGGKWAFNKAATVKLLKDKTSAEWDDSKGKSNLSGLKLTYTPKTGLFKGLFKVYALEGADGAKKLRKYTANVTGVVVDGKGFGQASIKKPAAGPWAVTVE